MAAGPDGHRGRPADPLPHQRAFGSVAPVLAEEGVRRVGAAHGPAQPVEPLPDAAAEQVGALHRARVPVLLLEVGHPPHRRPRHRTRAVHGHPVQADDRLAAVVLAADPLLVHGDLQHRHLLHVLLLRRHRHLQARRDQDPLRRRLGPGPGAAPGQRDRRLPRATGRDRGEGRPRPQRHPAVGAARHRQDADGRGRRRRDRQAVHVRRPLRLHPDLHGRRPDEGEVDVPQGPQAGPAPRRRRRVLRRGRRPRQPGRDQRQRGAGAGRGGSGTAATACPTSTS